MSYLILDTETTGTGKTDTVLQLAYQCFDSDGTMTYEYCKVFKPDFDYEIHEKATEINGFTKEIIDSIGEDAEEYTKVLCNMRKFAGRTYVGHNVSFDLRMLNQDLARYSFGRIEPESFCTMNDPKIKAFVGATDKNNKPKAPNLAELYRKLFGEEITGAHDALADVRATARCFFELKRLGIVTV